MTNRRHMRIRYRAFRQDRPCVFKTTRGWVITHGHVTRTTSTPYPTFAQAITDAHPAPVDYPTGEQPPIATVRALLQAAWD